MKKMNMYSMLYTLGMYMMCVSAIIFMISACEEEINGSSRTLLKSLQSIDLALTYNVLEESSEGGDTQQQSRTLRTTNNENLDISINGMPAAGTFVRTFTDDFEDTSDELYLFHRIYALAHDSLPEENQLSVYLLVNKAKDIVEEGFIQIDFIESPQSKHVIYTLDTENIENLNYDFENFTFTFTYNGEAKRQKVDESLQDIFPENLEDLALSIQGTQ